MKLVENLYTCKCKDIKKADTPMSAHYQFLHELIISYVQR